MMKVEILSAEGFEKFFVLPLISFSLNDAPLKVDSNLCSIIQSIALYAKSPDEIILDEIYLVSGFNNDSLWYRAKVLKTEDFYEVFLIDNGRIMKKLKKNQFKMCSKALSKIKPLIVQCCLKDSALFIKHRPEADNLFKFIVSKRKTFVMVIKEKKEDLIVVDLEIDNFSVSDLMKNNYGLVFEPKINITLKTLKELKIPQDTSIEIKTSWINSPSDFYVSIVSMEQEKELMREEMKAFYQQNPVKFTMIVPGMICVVEDDNGNWHRVEVQTSPGKDNWCKVIYVDSGKEEFVLWHSIYELADDFYSFPRYAKRYCSSLADIIPIEGHKTWSEDSIEFFRRHLINCDDRIDLVESNNRVHLFVCHKATKIYINQSLVIFQHAKSTIKAKNNSRYPLFEASDEECKSKDDKNEDFNEKLHPVKIINREQINAGDFLIQFLDHEDNIKMFNELIQKNIENCLDVSELKVGELCLVNLSFKNNNNQDIVEWHRAIINKIDSRLHLTICDHQDEDEEVSVTFHNVIPIPEYFQKIKFLTARVKIDCSWKNCWGHEEVEIVQQVFKSFDNFFVKFKDNNSIQLASDRTIRPVILYGSKENKLRYNIISLLEEKGVAISHYAERRIVEVDLLENRFTSKIMKYVGKKIADELDNFDPFFASLPDILDSRYVTIGDYSVKLMPTIIKNWLPTKTSQKSSFVASISNVGKDGSIFMIDQTSLQDLRDLTNIINKYYNQTQVTKGTFKEGQPCLAPFYGDDHYHRGIVRRVNGDSCDVEFIDYGNIQCDMPTDSLSFSVLCSEIPPIVERYYLTGSPPKKNGVIDQSVLDKFQYFANTFVGSINIHLEDIKINDPNHIKRCSILVNGYNFNTYKDIITNLELSSDDDSC